MDMDEKAMAEARKSAMEISETALWKKLFNEYRKAYE